MLAIPALVVAMAGYPSSSTTRALVASQTLGKMTACEPWCSWRKVSALADCCFGSNELMGTPLKAEFFQLVRRARKNGLAALCHDRPLNQFRMGNHGLDELIVGEILSGNELLVSVFLGANSLGRLEPGALE